MFNVYFRKKDIGIEIGEQFERESRYLANKCALAQWDKVAMGKRKYQMKVKNTFINLTMLH